MMIQTAATKPAFRFDVSPQTLRNVENVGLPLHPQRFWKVFGTVLVLHMAIFVLKPSLFWRTPMINTEEEWEVNMEFPGEISLKSPQQTALPDSQKAEEESVAKNLLPQLPKKFQIEEQKPPEERPVPESPEKTEEAVAQEKVEPKEVPVVPKTEEDANKVDLDDLRKRLAVEKLKQEKKTSAQRRSRMPLQNSNKSDPKKMLLSIQVPLAAWSG